MHKKKYIMTFANYNIVFYNINMLSNVSSKICLVFLHGFLVDHSIWNQQVIAFHKEYNILLVDFPAHGKSDILQRKNVSYQKIAQDIKTSILKLMPNKQYIFIGNSMGGAYAYLLAYLLPKSTKGVLALAPITPKNITYGIKSRLTSLLKFLRLMFHSSYIQKIQKLFNLLPIKLIIYIYFKIFYYKQSKYLMKIYLPNKINRVQKSNNILYFILNFIRRLPSWERLYLIYPQLNIPVCTVISKRDRVLNYKVTKKDLQNINIKNHKIIILSDAKHIIPLAHPQKTNHLIKFFLETIYAESKF